MTDSNVIFRAGAFVGIFLKAIFIKQPVFTLFLLQTNLPPHTLLQWLWPFLLRLLELACAGIVTGFFGTLGKKIYERTRSGKSDGVKES